MTGHLGLHDHSKDAENGGVYARFHAFPFAFAPESTSNLLMLGSRRVNLSERVFVEPLKFPKGEKFVTKYNHTDGSQAIWPVKIEAFGANRHALKCGGRTFGARVGTVHLLTVWNTTDGTIDCTLDPLVPEPSVSNAASANCFCVLSAADSGSA
jgi:hypothetical protein